MSDRFWNEVRVNEWRRDFLEPCAECGYRTFHRVDCSRWTPDRNRALARRRLIDARLRAWRESIGG